MGFSIDEYKKKKKQEKETSPASASGQQETKKTKFSIDGYKKQQKEAERKAEQQSAQAAAQAAAEERQRLIDRRTKTYQQGYNAFADPMKAKQLGVSNSTNALAMRMLQDRMNVGQQAATDLYIEDVNNAIVQSEALADRRVQQVTNYNTGMDTAAKAQYHDSIEVDPYYQQKYADRMEKVEEQNAFWDKWNEMETEYQAGTAERLQKQQDDKSKELSYLVSTSTPENDNSAEIARLQSEMDEIENKKREYNANVIQGYKDYAASIDPSKYEYKNDPKADYYIQKSVELGNPVFYLGRPLPEWEDLEKFNDGHEETRSWHAFAPQVFGWITGDLYNGGNQRSLNFMTDDQKREYSYILGKYGRIKADEYLNEVEKSATYYNAAELAANGSPLPDDSNVDRFIKFGSGVKTSLGAGISSWSNKTAYGFERQFEGVLGKEGSTDYAMMDPNEIAFSILGETSGGFSRTAQEVAQNITQMAPAQISGIVTSACTAGASLWVQLLASLGSTVSTMGPMSYGAAYERAIMEGYSVDQAREYALASEANEAFGEWALGGIEGVSGGFATKAIGQASPKANIILKRNPILKLGVDAAVEGAEEIVQGTVDQYLQNSILGKDNQITPFTEENWHSAMIASLSVFLQNASSAAVDAYQISNLNVSDIEEISKALRSVESGKYINQNAYKAAMAAADVMDRIADKKANGEIITFNDKVELSNAIRDIDTAEKEGTGIYAQMELDQQRELIKEGFIQGFDEEGAKAYNQAFIDAEDGSIITDENNKGKNPMSVDEYKAFSAYYNYGRFGTEVSEETAEKASKLLTTEQRTQAMKAGALDANKAYPSNVVSQITKNAKAAKVVGVREGKVHEGDVNLDNLTEQQKLNVSVISNAIAKGLGFDVKLVESVADYSRDSRGKYTMKTGASYHAAYRTEDGVPTIYLDVNAGMNTKSDWSNDVGRNLKKVLPAISHEITHWMETTDEVEYKKLSDMVISTLINDKEYIKENTINSYVAVERAHMQQIEDKLGTGKQVTVEDALHEIVARACEDMLNGNKTMEDAFVKSLTRAEKTTLWEHVKDIFNNVREFFQKLLSNYESNSQEAQAIRRNMDSYEEIRKQWAKILDQPVSEAEFEDNGVAKDGESFVSDTGMQLTERTFQEGGRDFLNSYLQKQVKKKEITQADMDDILNQMDAMYDIMQEIKKKNPNLDDYSKWADTVATYNENGEKLSVIVKNGDYSMNLDFSTVCKKRKALNHVLNSMVSSGKLNINMLIETDVAELNDIIKGHDFEIACALCFVDSKRYRIGAWSNSFTEGVHDTKKAEDERYGFNEMVRSLVPKGSNIQVDEYNFTGREIAQPEGQLLKDYKGQLDYSLVDKIMKTKGKSTAQYRMAKAIKTNPNLRSTLNSAEIISSVGLDKIRVENTALYGLINSHQGTAKPKFALSESAYVNDILNANGFQKDKAYKVGGVRLQSFSDFMANMVFDYAQMIGDMQAKKLPAHCYTKEAAFVEIFGLTGMKINMSLVPKATVYTSKQLEEMSDSMKNKLKKIAGLKQDKNGKHVVDGVSYSYMWEDETFPYEVAMKIQADPEYSKNCGTIAVGISDTHIRALLQDPTIQMVIPYHKSGLPHQVAMMRNISLYNDYTDQQNTRHKDGTKLGKKEKDFDFYGYLYGNKKFKDGSDAYKQTGRTPTDAANAYLEWCDKKGYLPKFDKFRDNANYYKLLTDFRVYDTDGTYVPQNGVQLNFPSNVSDLITNGVSYKQNGKTKVSGGLAYAQEVNDKLKSETDQIVKEFEKKRSLQRSERNDNYMDAIKNGDINRAEDIMKQAARDAGYSTLTRLFHGTQAFGFTDFDPALMDDGISIFVTDSEKTAQSYVSDDAKIRNISDRSQRTIDDYSDEEVAKTYNAHKATPQDIKKFNDTIDSIFTQAEDMIKSVTKTHPVQRKKMITALNDMKSGNMSITDYQNFIDTLPDNLQDAMMDPRTASQWRQMMLNYESGEMYIGDNGSKTMTEMRQSLATTMGEGIYQLFGKEDNMMIVNCNGQNWKEITYEGKTYTTRELSELAKDRGYDGVMFNELVDVGGNTEFKDTANIRVYFNPSSLKSADIITYDNNNQIISLDERFDSSNKDLRYMTRETEYSNAVKSNDLVRAKDIVKEYAEMKGFTVRVLHGTLDFGFTKVMTTGVENYAWSPFFATDSEETANSYSYDAGNRTIRKDVSKVALEKESAKAYDEFKSSISSFGTMLESIIGIRSYMDYGQLETEFIDRLTGAVEDGHDPSMIQDDLYELGEEWINRLYDDYVNNMPDNPYNYDNSELEPKYMPSGDLLGWSLNKDGEEVWYAPIYGYQQMLDAEGLDAVKEAIYKEANEYKYDQTSFLERSDVQKVSTALDEVVQNAIDYSDVEDRLYNADSRGNYEMYANTDGMLEIDAKGDRWNSINLPYQDELKYYEWAKGTQYAGKPINTRYLAEYAKAKGYSGVIIQNLWDNGGKGKKITKPATVYIFFDPQTQLKSADAVTYDDNDQPIPLDKRFDTTNPVTWNDLRYKGRDASITEERLDYLIEDSGAGSRTDYAREWITSINPTDFLNMTLGYTNQNRAAFDDLPGEYGSRVNDRDFTQDLKNNMRQTPYLAIDIDTGEVITHEGRHRMRSLEKQGIQKVDIVVEFYKDNRLVKEMNGYGNPLTTIGSKKIINQFGTGQTTTLSNIIPINQSTRDEILQSYGNKNADIQYKQRDDNKAKEFFGTTNDPYRAGYILSDGSMLDFRNTNNRIGLDADWFRELGMVDGEEFSQDLAEHLDHDMIDLAYDEEDFNGFDAMSEYIQDGNVRMIFSEKPYDTGIQLSSKVEPTAKQYEQIERSAEKAFTNGQTLFVEYGGMTYEGREVFSANSTGRDVVNNIKYYYANGQTRNSVNQFRYKERDNAGRELSQGQVDYFKDSKIRDKDGNLIRLYHGSPRTGFTIFNRMGGEFVFTTTDRTTAEKNYANNRGEMGMSDVPSVNKKTLDELQNASTLDELNKVLADMSHGWTNVTYNNGEYHYWAVDTADNWNYDEGSFVTDTLEDMKKLLMDPAWETTTPGVYELYGNMINPFIVDAEGKRYNNLWKPGTDYGTDTVSIARYAKENGYDGVIIKNVVDGSKYPIDDYVFFNSNQLKLIDNLNPTQSDDIRYKQRDSEYMSAVESGDMTKAQQMVDNAALDAGYTIRVYHGTGEYGERYYFATGNRLSWMSTTYDYANVYADKYIDYDDSEENIGVYKLYLNPGRVLNIGEITADAYSNYDKGIFSKEMKDVLKAIGWNEDQLKKWIENDVRNDINSFWDDYDAAVWMFTQSTAFYNRVKELRYDSVHAIENGVDTYGITSSSMTKSSDPVTYDKNGQIIPLSQRFNDQNDDIRYSFRENFAKKFDEWDKKDLKKIFDISITSDVGKNVNTQTAERGRDIHAEYDEFVKKYGAIPKGEKAVKDVQVPQRVSKGTKVSRFVRTVLESGVTSDMMDEKIKKSVVKDAMSYVPVTDQQTLNFAESTIRISGIDKARESWDNRHKGNEGMTKQDMVMGEVLLKKYAEAGDVENVVKMTQQLAQEATRAGQEIQACRMLKRMAEMVPEIGLGYIQVTVDSMNDEYEQKVKGKTVLTEAGKGKFKKLTIDQALAQKYLDAQTQDEIDAAVGAIYDDLAKQTPKTFLMDFGDRARAWRYVAMLGNPRTHIRNMAGNGLFMPTVALKNVIGTGLEKAFVKEGEKTKAIVLNKDALAFAKDDFVLMQPEVQGEKVGTMKQEILKRRKIFHTKGMNFLSNLNTNLLEAEDLWALRIHYVNAMAQYMTANKLTGDNITEAQLGKARAYAMKEAQKATYRDASAVATWLNNAGKLGKGMNILMEGLVPFKKTPINILKRGVEYSPAGLIKALTLGTKQLNDGKISVNEYIDGISSGLSGSAVFMIGFFLSGTLIKGASGDDDKDKDKLKRQQEYAIQIGNHTYTIDWMAPGSLPLFMGVETAAALRRNEGSLSAKDIAKIGQNLVEPMINLSVLSGINDAIDNAKYADGNIMPIVYGMVFNYLGQFIPTLSGQFARTIDTTRRINYVDKNKPYTGTFLYFIEKMQNKIPLMSFSNDPYVDEWGQEDKTSSHWVAALENFVSPGYISELRDDKVTNEVLRLQDEQDENVLPKMMDKYIGSGDDRKDLTSKEYYTYQQTAGRTAYIIIDNMTDDPRYDMLDADQQAAAVKYAYDYAKYVGRKAIQPEWEAPTTDQWLTKARLAYEENGTEVYDTILTTVQVKTLEDNAIGEINPETGKMVSGSKQRDIWQQILDGPGTAAEKGKLYAAQNPKDDLFQQWTDKKYSAADYFKYSINLYDYKNSTNYKGEKPSQEDVANWIRKQVPGEEKRKLLWQMAGYGLYKNDDPKQGYSANWIKYMQ